MTKNNAAPSDENARGKEPNLDSRYGEIGISAVAAAVLRAAGVPVEAHTCHGLGHSIDEDGLNLGIAFLQRIFGLVA